VGGRGRLLPQAESRKLIVSKKARMERYGFIKFLIKPCKRFQDQRSTQSVWTGAAVLCIIILGRDDPY